MTIEEFVEQLTKTSKHFNLNWEINKQRGLRLNGPLGLTFCPLTAVATMSYDEHYDIDSS